MTTAAAYAKALHELVDKSDLSKKQMAAVRAALERRGHLKLLPAILSEYQKIELANTRSKARNTITPTSERNRALLELYRKLINSR